MIYIDTASFSAEYNFAVEEYISSVWKPSETVFLCWGTAPTLMIGRFQNTRSEINSEYVRSRGIDVVRRRSGGGTIYTDEGGRQFSYWFPDARHADISFRQAGQAVVDALHGIGVQAYYSQRNDILVDGRKISGNARYVTGSGMINHGSLLFDTDIEAMVRALTVSDEKLVSKGIRSVRQRITNIKDHLKQPMSVEEFNDYMISSICGDCAVYQFSAEEQAQIDDIARRYGSWEWNYGGDPDFELVRENRFAGGKVSCCLNVSEGRIRDISFYGDFFAVGSVEELCAALRGVRLRRDELLAAVQSKGIDMDKIMYMISGEELLSLIL